MRRLAAAAVVGGDDTVTSVGERSGHVAELAGSVGFGHQALIFSCIEGACEGHTLGKPVDEEDDASACNVLRRCAADVMQTEVLTCYQSRVVLLPAAGIFHFWAL